MKLFHKFIILVFFCITCVLVNLYLFNPSKQIISFQKSYTANDNNVKSLDSLGIRVDYQTNSIYLSIINERTVSTMTIMLDKIQRNNPKSIIFNLHSIGGDVNEALSIIHTFEVLNDHNIKIIAKVNENEICTDECMLIFINANDRIAHKHSVFGFFNPRNMTSIIDYNDIFKNFCGAATLFSNKSNSIIYSPIILQNKCNKFFTKIL